MNECTITEKLNYYIEQAQLSDIATNSAQWWSYKLSSVMKLQAQLMKLQAQLMRLQAADCRLKYYKALQLILANIISSSKLFWSNFV